MMKNAYFESQKVFESMIEFINSKTPFKDSFEYNEGTVSKSHLTGIFLIKGLLE